MTAWLVVLAGILAASTLGLMLLRQIRGPAVGVWAWAGQLGAGYVLGVLLCGVALWLSGSASIRGATITLAWLVGGSLVALVWLERLRGAGWRRDESPAAPALTDGSRILMRAILLLLLIAGVLITLQALALPTLTWDAWNAWLSKSKAWHHAGVFLPFHDLGTWLQQAPGTGFSTVGAPYPEALPRFAAMLTGLAGEWRDAYPHLLWPLLWLAMGLHMASALRAAGAGPLLALAATAALLTLPMVTAHASLAGYADLWLAAAILLAASHAAAYWQRRQRRDLVLALLVVVLLPAIKLEGAIYTMLLLGTLLLWWLPGRLRLGLMLLGPPLLLGLAFTTGLHLPLPGVGWLVLEWGAATAPLIGRLELFWRPVGATVATSLLLLPNWSLLWYLAPALLAWHWRQLRRPELGLLLTFLVGALVFHFVLFFFTDASAWAEDLTSLNRLLMHTVPVWVFSLALLLAVPAPVRGRYA